MLYGTIGKELDICTEFLVMIPLSMPLQIPVCREDQKGSTEESDLTLVGCDDHIIRN